MKLNDVEIKKLSLENQMISPFIEKSTNKKNGHKIPSYGLSSFGYDVRLQNKFSIYNSTGNRALDLLDPNTINFVELKVGEKAFAYERGEDYIIIPPGGFVLSVTEEYFKIPENLTANVLNKSTWARLGLEVLTTVLEPGWEGELVIEISNKLDYAIKLYAGVGIAQLEFHKGNVPSVNYKDRNGKYQGQTGIQVAKL